jgi:hypothetical protein
MIADSLILRGSHRHRSELRFLQFDHIADIEELVVPDIQPGEP